MKTWHPESWSKQARNMSNDIIESINVGYETIEGAISFFSRSYRAPLIRYRAAKRFGRKVREGKVHENLTEYYKHFPEERMNENA